MENVAKTHSSFPSLIHKVSTSLCTSIPFSFSSKCFSAVLQSWLLWEIFCHHSTQNVLDTQVPYFLPVLSLQLPACFLYLGYPGLLLVFLGHASLTFPVGSSFCLKLFLLCIFLDKTLLYSSKSWFLCHLFKLKLWLSNYATPCSVCIFFVS